MGQAHDIDPWVRPPVGRGPDGTNRFAAAQASGPSVDFSFADLLDVINPLHHIPLVSSIYRKLTGDEISPHARIIGATLYGGPLGLVVATQVALVEQASGKPIETIATAGLFTESATEMMANAEDPAAGIEIAPAAGRAHRETVGPTPDQASPGGAPEPPGAAYSGQAALRAYLRDLQTLGEPEEESGDPAASNEITPAACWDRHETAGLTPDQVSPGAACGGPADLRAYPRDPQTLGEPEEEGGDPAFTQRMMEGLRKYESMAPSGANGYPARAPQVPNNP